MRLIDADSLIEEINKVYVVEEKEDLKWAKGLHYAKTIIRNMPTIEEDALALLKENGKAKVIFKQYDGSIETECGNCGQHLDKAYSECPKCRKELDWDA